MIPAEVSRHWQWGILHIVKSPVCKAEHLKGNEGSDSYLCKSEQTVQQL